MGWESRHEDKLILEEMQVHLFALRSGCSIVVECKNSMARLIKLFPSTQPLVTPLFQGLHTYQEVTTRRKGQRIFNVMRSSKSVERRQAFQSLDLLPFSPFLCISPSCILLDCAVCLSISLACVVTPPSQSELT